jgi:hypothetical protein
MGSATAHPTKAISADADFVRRMVSIAMCPDPVENDLAWLNVRRQN